MKKHSGGWLSTARTNWNRKEPPSDLAILLRQFKSPLIYILVVAAVVTLATRYDGVESFLVSRGVTLPFGDPEDSPAAEAICGLGNKKNALFHAELAAHGVDRFEDSVALGKRKSFLRTAPTSLSMI